MIAVHEPEGSVRGLHQNPTYVPDLEVSPNAPKLLILIDPLTLSFPINMLESSIHTVKTVPKAFAVMT